MMVPRTRMASRRIRSSSLTDDATAFTASAMAAPLGSGAMPVKGDTSVVPRESPVGHMKLKVHAPQCESVGV